MSDDIRKIEDYSINAWPSWQLQFYDGWILRYSAFYTHRTNCVEQLGLSVLPLEEKIAHCEKIYRHWNTPCIFKISPIGDPALDGILEHRGYHIEHHTTVMVRSLSAFTEPSRDYRSKNVELRIDPRVTPQWIDALFRFKDTKDPIFHRIVPRMYDAIPMDEIAVTALSDGKIVGTGLGILDRDAVGVYAIHVADHARRRGIASGIVNCILNEGRLHGASVAYLQVVTDNSAAKSVYRRLGFEDCYRYWFRVKEV